MTATTQNTGHGIAYPLAGSKAKRLKKLELPVSDTALRATYHYGNPDVTVILDSLANISGTSLQEAPGGGGNVLNLGDFKIIVKNDDTSTWERGRGVTLAVLESSSLAGNSKIELPTDFDAEEEWEYARQRRPYTLPKFIHPENILTGSASAHDVSLTTGCRFAGDATVKGGKHSYLLASGNAHVECAETQRASFILGGTIKGNYIVRDMDFYGDGIEINDLGTMPAGSPPLTIECQDGLYGVPLYDALMMDGYTSFSNNREDVHRFYCITRSIVEDGRFWNQRLCLNTQLHKQYTQTCHCLIWLPHILTFDPVAIHYLIRVSGLLGDPKVKLPLAQDSAANPLAALPMRDIEETLAANLNAPNVLMAWHRGGYMPEEWGEAWLSNLEACNIPLQDVVSVWGEKPPKLYKEGINSLFEYVLGLQD